MKNVLYFFYFFFQDHFGIQVNAFIFLNGKLRTACKNVDGSAVDSRLSQTNFKLVAVEWGGGGGGGGGNVDSSAVGDLKKSNRFWTPSQPCSIRVTLAADPCVQHTTCSHHDNQIHKGESCHFLKSWPVMQETHAFHWWCAVPSASTMGKWCHFSSITCTSLRLTSQQRLLWIKWPRKRNTLQPSCLSSRWLKKK